MYAFVYQYRYIEIKYFTLIYFINNCNSNKTILWWNWVYHTCRHTFIPYLYLLQLSSWRWAFGFETCACNRYCEKL